MDMHVPPVTKHGIPGKAVIGGQLLTKEAAQRNR